MLGGEEGGEAVGDGLEAVRVSGEMLLNIRVGRGGVALHGVGGNGAGSAVWGGRCSGQRVSISK